MTVERLTRVDSPVARHAVRFALFDIDDVQPVHARAWHTRLLNAQRERLHRQEPGTPRELDGRRWRLALVGSRPATRWRHVAIGRVLIPRAAVVLAHEPSVVGPVVVHRAARADLAVARGRVVPVSLSADARGIYLVEAVELGVARAHDEVRHSAHTVRSRHARARLLRARVLRAQPEGKCEPRLIL